MRARGRGFMGAGSLVFSGPASQPWIGSIGLPTVQERAQTAISEYDSLVTRTSELANDQERAKIVGWIGNVNVPGSPAERYAAVASDLQNGQPNQTLQAKRVTDLENVLQDFRSKVADAEAAFGTVTEADKGQVTDTSGALSGRGIAMIAIAAISLFVLPFAMD